MNEAALARALDRAEALCRQRGVRLTALRRTVLELLCAADRPLGAYELLEHMATDARRPAPPTVYRTLDFLVEQGLVHRLESLHAYVGCTHPEHPHSGQFLICSDCGTVSEIDNEEIERSLHSVVQARGFKTQKPVVEVLGTCAQCAAKSPEDD